MKTCTFCRIAQGQETADIVFQDTDVTAFHDANPQAPAHVLIIPNRHIGSVAQVQSQDAELLGKLFIVARRVAQEEGLEAGYRLVVNTGSQAGQTIHHLHVHLLGGRRMDWPPG